MANIYEEQNEALHQLLDRARSEEGATVLIPDLQRPYVWTPNQVTLLVDSLIRGWPFGTLLMWKLGQNDIQNIPHRQFWKVADRTRDGDGSALMRKDPPASFHMVLDGQQRLQSLLLALGGDGWGFKMEDRDWAEELLERRPRGRRGQNVHWSKACLCFDLDAFLHEYNTTGSGQIEYRNVLRWVITDPADGQSKLKKPDNYEEPLLKAFDATNTGRFIRLSRLWAAATPNPNIKEGGFRDIASKLFKEEGIPEAKIKDALAPIGELMTTLRDVKLSKVTFLELVPFDESIWTEDSYNDAIVNIFTRLNTAGRTLTREEITLAWLKVGWKADATDCKSAGECFQGLLAELADRGLHLSMDDLVSAVSVIWSVAHNGGKLLENRDLLKGQVIRPMANALAGDWKRISRAILECTDAIAARNLEYGAGAQYASLNAMVILWAWYFLAASWEETHLSKVIEKDDFQKKYKQALNTYADRWLLGSQWAGRWAEASNRAVGGYVKGLHADGLNLKAETKPGEAQKILEDRLKYLTADIVDDAVHYVETVAAPARERVSMYRNVLWIWHRIDKDRWKMSQIQLRTGRSKKTSTDVDHTVAFELWRKIVAENDAIDNEDDAQSALGEINALGNCSLLDKSFNISKSDKTAKSFLENVHEFKEGKVTLQQWCQFLAIPDVMLDAESGDMESILKAINDRDKLVRNEVIEFVRGNRARVDLDA